MIFQLPFYIEMELCCGTAESRRGNVALGKYILPIKVKTYYMFGAQSQNEIFEQKPIQRTSVSLHMTS
jgi:hypothetical protein